VKKNLTALCLGVLLLSTLLAACSKKYNLSPDPAKYVAPTATFTPTPTVTGTATETPVFTFTVTSTPTASFTPTVTATDTPSCSYTPPAGLLYVVTPGAGSVLTELESPCEGGPDNGTNEYCAITGYTFAPEDIGTVTQTQSLAVSGILETSGNDGSSWLPTVDYDTYLFTVGEDGYYAITLDGMTTTTDGNVFLLYIQDANCGSISTTSNWDGSTTYQPTAGMNSPLLTTGTQLTLSVAAWVAPDKSPYRLTIVRYDSPTPTPTP